MGLNSNGIAPGKEASDKASSSSMEDGVFSSPPSMPYFALYKNCDTIDVLLLLLGSFGAMLAGAGWPAWTILFGEVIDAFGKGGDVTKRINEIVVYMLVISIAMLIGGYLQISCFTITGNRQANRLREKYMRAALLQNISFFDVEAKTGSLLQGLNNDNAAVQKGVGEKVGHFLQFFSTFIIGMTVAFVRGWDLTLVVLATMPIIAPSGLLMSKILAKANVKIDAYLSKANSLANEAISNIRTVAAFNQQERIVQDFDKNLIVPAQQGLVTGFGTGIGFGTFYLWFWGSFGLGLYYGALRVFDGKMTGGQVLNVFVSAMVGGFNLGQALPQLQYFTEAAASGARIWAVINRKPEFSVQDGGEKPMKVEGSLSLKNVAFAYPARPDTIIFRDLSLDIPAGKQVALVGGTGSGKSTVISLVQRFYDPSAGQVLLDGVDIRRLDLGWLRSQMGLVSQEPTLFATTIRENIALGIEREVTQAEVEAAAKAANVHKFIEQLPEQYDTQVGERGVHLSGGQKQRIAIARAVLRNPRVLLLDEATSALDTASEKAVQQALDTLMTGRTTVVVAHRLSTIMHADIIAVVREGIIAERGSHEELLQLPNGVYKALVKLQTLESPAEEQSGEEDPDAVIALEAGRASLEKLGPRHSKELARADVKPLSMEMSAGHQLQDVETGKQPTPPKGSFVRLLKLNAPEWYFALIGCFCAVIVGCMMPSISFLLGEAIANFYKEKSKLKPAMAQVAGYMALVSGGAFLATLVQQICLGIMGARLARRVRAMLLRSILAQEIAFFDEEKNSSAALISRLTSDSAYIRGAVGDTLSVITQSVTVLLYANILALVLGWKLALVVMATIPLVAAGAIIETKLMTSFLSSSNDAYATANQTASESFGSVRVVQSYGLEETLVDMYRRKLAAPLKESIKGANVSAVGFGYSQGVVHAVYAMAYWYGAKQVVSGEMTFEEMFKVVFAVLMGALGLAQAQMVFPDMGKAKEAVANVFTLLDRVPVIDSIGDNGNKPNTLKGSIELSDVHFAYPARPGVTIFSSFNLVVQPAQSMALVGESGSGKSTIIGLLLRFYDPQSGVVRIDGIDVKQYHLKTLRQHYALVAQEPVLFQGTIRENILFGRPSATQAEVEEAARIANATEFIDRITAGFDTQVGERGGQLSGGQKQRIAIARAVLRNPRILLLDEATSALDASSEALVQEALDRLMQGRTSVIIAHRLSTIRNANVISVISRGQVVEQGSHDELLTKQGAYGQLVKAQMKRTPSAATMNV